MKKSISLFISLILIITTTFSNIVFSADDMSQSTQNGNKDWITPNGYGLIDTKYTSDKLYLNIYIENAPNFIPGNMVFGVYSSDGIFLEAQKIFVSDIAADYTITFNVPEYNYGDTFYVKLFSGAVMIQYIDDFYKINDMIPLQTYTYSDAERKQIYGDTFHVSATPLSSRYITADANGWELYFKNPAKIINNICFIPLEEYLGALEMTDCMSVDNDTGKIEIKSGFHKVVFYLNGNDMYVDDKVTYSDTTPLKINGVIYVPFRFLVEGLGGKITTKNSMDGKLCVSASLFHEPLPEDFVNSKGITSKTDYLVWVSKKNFKVAVFINNDGEWKAEKFFSCSIGAPSTPTITGQFEYFSKEPRWSYNTYYVGPIMRFYKGYALHSTLIRYNGTIADGRLGMKISHGCVRLAPDDIQWLVDMIPLHTKIYVTNE